jgi:energy-coupling factor transporter ATP-binding protein EcfA2
MTNSFSGEQLLLQRLFAILGPSFPRVLLTSYYISLKTNPLVVLIGPEGIGKAALAEGLARAVLGTHTTQFVTIAGTSWTRESSHGHYYRTLHQQFGVFSFLETLHEAAAPENIGKLYFILIKGLIPDDLQHFFRQLLYVDQAGEKRLSIPGLVAEEQPILPPNVLITTTLHVPRSGSHLNHAMLREAALIEIVSTLRPGNLPRIGTLTPPPVGLQRLLLQQSVRDPGVARQQLTRLLGSDAVDSLGPSYELHYLLQMEGLVLNKLQRDTMLMYVANSFDANGYGLFDASDVYHNAQVAFDAQMIQRVLWQIPARSHDQLRWRLSTYLEAGAGNW